MIANTLHRYRRGCFRQVDSSTPSKHKAYGHKKQSTWYASKVGTGTYTSWGVTTSWGSLSRFFGSGDLMGSPCCRSGTHRNPLILVDCRRDGPPVIYLSLPCWFLTDYWITGKATIDCTFKMAPLHFMGRGHQVLTSWNSDFRGKVTWYTVIMHHFHYFSKDAGLLWTQQSQNVISITAVRKTEKMSCWVVEPLATALYPLSFAVKKAFLTIASIAWCIPLGRAPKCAYDPSVASESNVLGQPDG